MSAVRLASTFAYAARHSDWVVISALKFEISCDTCVRASPCSFAASGIVVIWLRVSRARLKCVLAAAGSTWPAGAAGGVAGGCCSGGCCAGGCCDCVAGGCEAGGVDCAPAAIGSARSAAVATAADHRALSIGECLLEILISCQHGTEQARCPRTSTAISGRFSRRARRAERSSYLLDRADAAWPPPVREQLRLLVQVFPDEVGRGFEPEGRRALGVGHLELELLLVVRRTPDLTDDQIVFPFEEPDHADAMSKRTASEICGIRPKTVVCGVRRVRTGAAPHSYAGM